MWTPGIYYAENMKVKLTFHNDSVVWGFNFNSFLNAETDNDVSTNDYTHDRSSVTSRGRSV